ncbi:MAG: hypothetical protein WCK34_09490 [Bacteroidota bacterium]
MEKENLSNDDFLRGLIQQSPLESPSDDFVDRVMAGILVAPETAPVRKPFYLYLKTIVPYALLALLVLLVFFTSDIPFLNWFPGKNYVTHNLVPYFETLFSGLKNAFSSRYVSFGLLIITSTGLLFLVDQLFSRRTTA